MLKYNFVDSFFYYPFHIGFSFLHLPHQFFRMRKILLCFYFILFQGAILFAADNYPAGARSLALANSSVTNIDCWSAFHNQAALAWITRMEVGASYDNRFTIANLSTESFAFALPLKAGTFAVSGNVFGYSQYNETRVEFVLRPPRRKNGSAIWYSNPDLKEAFWSMSFSSSMLHKSLSENL